MFGLDSSSVTSIVRSFLLLCCLIVFMMKSLGYPFCCRAAKICCFSSSLSFSPETMLSALSNKAVMTQMLNDVKYSSGIGRYVLVFCKLLLIWFCLDSVQLGCRGMVVWNLVLLFL